MYNFNWEEKKYLILMIFLLILFACIVANAFRYIPNEEETTPFINIEKTQKFIDSKTPTYANSAKNEEIDDDKNIEQSEVNQYINIQRKNDNNDDDFFNDDEEEDIPTN